MSKFLKKMTAAFTSSMVMFYGVPNIAELVPMSDLSLNAKANYSETQIDTADDTSTLTVPEFLAQKPSAELSGDTLTISGNIVKNEVQAYAGNSAVKKVVAENGAVLPADCSDMFNNFKAVSIDLSQADSSNVTKINGMFYNCNNLVELNLSGFNTSKVTSMSYMFSYCNSLKTLDLNSFDTSKVPKMECVFYLCNNLTELDLSSFDTSNVTSMKRLFYKCSKLMTIKVSDKWNIASDKGPEMFYGCTSLAGACGTIYNSSYTGAEYARCDKKNAPGYLTPEQSIVLSEGTLTLRSNVIKKEVQAYANNEEVKSVVAEEGSVLPADCSNMFENFKALSIDLSQADSSNVTRINAMFYNCKNLTELNLSGFNTSNVTSMSYMFSYCNSLKSLDLGSFNTSKVPKMDGLFYNCVDLTALDISTFNTSNVTSMTSMFSGSNKLKTIIVGYKWDTSKVNSSNNMFKGCTSLVGGNGTVYNSACTNAEYARIDTSETPGYLTAKSTLEGDTLILRGNIDKKEVQAYALNNAVKKVVAEKGSVLPADCSKMFEDFRALSIDLSQADSSKVKNMEKMFFYCMLLEKIDLSGFDTSNVTNMALMFCNCQSLKALDLSNFDTSKVVDMRSMFAICRWLKTLDISNFNTSEVKNMRYMFSECKRLKTIDVGRFNTSNVKDMSYMFDNCQAYETLDLSSFDTSNVTNMYSMFSSCFNLKMLDISSFNTSNVIDMNYMFGYCNKLTTIVVGNNWNTSKVNCSYDMFYVCTSLVGGNGTVYDASHKDKEYARIDTPEKPGYFTAASN